MAVLVLIFNFAYDKWVAVIFEVTVNIIDVEMEH